MKFPMGPAESHSLGLDHSYCVLAVETSASLVAQKLARDGAGRGYRIRTVRRAVGEKKRIKSVERYREVAREVEKPMNGIMGMERGRPGGREAKEWHYGYGDQKAGRTRKASDYGRGNMGVCLSSDKSLSLRRQKKDALRRQRSRVVRKEEQGLQLQQTGE